MYVHLYYVAVYIAVYVHLHCFALRIMYLQSLLYTYWARERPLALLYIYMYNMNVHLHWYIYMDVHLHWYIHVWMFTCIAMYIYIYQHTTCNTLLQHIAATHCCNTLLQHIAATHCCNTLPHIVIYISIPHYNVWMRGVHASKHALNIQWPLSLMYTYIHNIPTYECVMLFRFPFAPRDSYKLQVNNRSDQKEQNKQYICTKQFFRK